MIVLNNLKSIFLIIFVSAYINVNYLINNHITMKYSILMTFTLIYSLIYISTFSQVGIDSTNINFNEEIEKHRTGKNIKLMYSDPSPLLVEQKKNFEGLKYFPPDIKYLVEGVLVEDEEPETVIMKTSGERTPSYLRYGTVKFNIDGNELKLAVYQNKKMLDLSMDTNHLFVPFRDGTSGKESYKGGRYVDCVIPDEGNIMILDFNKAYNPYCAYNPKYSCVIPPEENKLSIRIEAGEKKLEEH